MGTPVFFPKRDVRYEHPRAHDVLSSRPQAMQSTLDIFQTLDALRISIADPDNLTIITKSRCAGNIDTVANANGA